MHIAASNGHPDTAVLLFNKGVKKSICLTKILNVIMKMIISWFLLHLPR